MARKRRVYHSEVDGANTLQPYCNMRANIGKRVRSEPDRFECMVSLSRGGTMRQRTLQERLLQISFFRGEGSELFADCSSIFVPLFGMDEATFVQANESSISLLLTQARLRRRKDTTSDAIGVQLLEKQLLECIRGHYKNHIFHELKTQRDRICLQKTILQSKILGLTPVTVLSEDGAVDDTTSRYLMLNADLHVSVLTRMMAEEKVADLRREFMCPLSRSLMHCPVTTALGTMYDRCRCANST